jgi:outer membrane protein
MKKSLIACGCAAALFSGQAALAQKAGTVSVSIGATRIAPSVSSENLTAPSLPNTKVDVNSDTQVTGAVNYMVTDAIAIHIPLGYGFKHEITGDGAIRGVGKLAETKALPITAIAQYRFLDANATFRPFVGAGVSYVRFYNEKGTGVLTAITNPGGPGTSVKFDSKLAPTFELGALFNINEKWYLEASYAKTLLKTRGTLSTGQTIDVKLDPNAYTFQIGYKF